jgi:competence protein ComEC
MGPPQTRSLPVTHAQQFAGSRFGHAHLAGIARPPPTVGERLVELLALEADRRRLFVWLPVFFMVGVLLYFAADQEPALWPSLTGAGFFVAMAVATRWDWRLQAAAIAIAAVFCGFSAAVIRTWTVAAPVLTQIVAGSLSGFVESIEERPAGARIVVMPTAIAGLDKAKLPARVRVTLRSRTDAKPGDFITTNARLLPPPEPARPGGYDFARDAFFRGIGAVGSISGAIQIGPPPTDPSWLLALNARIDAARNALTKRIAETFGGQAGAVAAALVTGKRGLISEETNDALRAAGIYRIVSISGLHMVLAAGTFFWSARAVLALFPVLALGWPIKKIAAVVAMLGATAYCIFSGSEVATERSLIMTLVMLGAILVDRPALSMRNLAIAALIVLAREPESLLGPSFQMSFAAVAGLIAFCERQPDEPGPREGRAPLGPLLRALRFVWRAIVGVVVTTCVATLATSPFSAFHFQTLNPLGVLGNALSLPFISLAIMPLGVVGVLAIPFGLDWTAWWLMGLATEPVLAAARAVATLERSTMLVPAFGILPLLLLVLAILWVTLWSTMLRWLAVVPAALGLYLAATPQRADILVDRAAIGAAIRGADGKLALVGRPSGFVTEQWLKADGDNRKATGTSLRNGAVCDRLGCVVRLPGGRAVAFVTDKRAFNEDCRRAAVVISRLTAPPSCKASLTVDRDRLSGIGSVAITASDAGFRLTTARDPNTSRPWLKPTERPRRPSTSPASEQQPITPSAPDAPQEDAGDLRQ